jgi:CHAT domain-containing protein/tetratricopeptide (TPR) repeat protein
VALVCLASVGVGAGCVGAADPPSSAPTGLVVDVVRPGYAAQRAGLRAGDVLSVASQPDLAALARRSAAGEPVVVTRVRPDPGELSLPLAEWGLEARPALPPSDEAAHLEARRALREGRPEAAERAWATLAARRAAASDRTGAAFFHLRRGEALLRGREVEAAGRASRAAAEAAGADGARGLAWTWEVWGDLLGGANQHALAGAAYDDALAHTPAADAGGRATLLQKRATARFRLSRFDEAAGIAREALALWEATAPRSVGCSTTLLLLARVERNGSRYEAARGLLERAQAAAHAADPDGPAEAATFAEQAVIAFHHGRLDDEERWGRQALDILERFGVRDLDRGRVHMGLGDAAYRRGDIAAAEGHFRAGLECFESEAPDGVQVGWAVNGLGDVLMARGDPEGAEQAYRRSAAIRAAISAGSMDHAISLNQVAWAARTRGDLAAAEQAYGTSLGIFERTIRDNYYRAVTLASLGEVVSAAGRLEEARGLLLRAVGLHEARARGSLEHAECLYALGGLEERAGRPADAERAYREALAIRSRLSPGSAVEAEALHVLGALERRTGRHERALVTLRRAVASLEAQRARLGGTPEDRARFGAMYAHVYKALLDLLLERDQPAEAFELLERYRVGSLGNLIARRDLRLAARARPAVLEDPRPPGLAEAARRLGDGTLLLSYAVLPERTVLFALPGGEAAPPLEVHSISVPERRLRKDLETVRDLLTSARAPAEGRATLRRRLGSLHDELLGPVAELLARSRRVLILPDGPLHLLPFGTLGAAADGRLRHLVQDRPVARAQAITLLAPAAASPADAGPPLRLLALGAPLLEEADGSGPPHAVLGRPLPQARAEVEALGRLYAGGARVFTGPEASEGRAKELAGDARYVHFACHGLTDDRFPLDSYLALRPSQAGGHREDGRLQAWEVCEQLSLRADLVVLSACDTALGAELAGAGLLGLTYAFQFAGARSVVASLWPVSDRSTSALMRVFHERLLAGDAPAEALRRAQLTMMATPLAAETGLAGGLRRLLRRPSADDLPLDAAEPYHWAAFQLFTDRP